MRRTAAVLTILAVLTVPTALLWRSDLAIDERDLHRLLDAGAGTRLHWRGEPQLTLLPTPSLTLRGVTAQREPGAAAGFHATIPRVEIALSVLPLLGGRVSAEEVRLFEPDIRLTAGAGGSDGPWRWLEQAGDVLPAALELIDATIRFDHARMHTVHRLDDVDLRLDWDRAEERLDAAGNGLLEDRRVYLTGTLLGPRQAFRPPGARAQLRIDGLTAPPLQAEGRIHLDRGEPPRGAELHIRDGSFRLGGSTASGELALSLTGSPPRVSGQLDFGTLALSRWLEAWWPDDLAELLALPVAGRWLRAVEGDLTLTAAGVDLGVVPLNDAEARVALEDGRLTLTVVEAGIADGRLSAEVSAVAAGEGIAFRSAGRLDDVALAEASENVGGRGLDVLVGPSEPPDGRGSGSFRITARGSTVRDLVHSLAGRVEIDVRDGSLYGANATATLERLLDGQAGIAEGNAPFIPIAGRTYFSRLSARLAAGNGTLWLEWLRLQGDAFEIALSGELDLTDGEVLARGMARLFDTDTDHRSSVLVELPFGVGGTLREPMGAPGIPRLDPGSDRTARADGLDPVRSVTRRDPGVG
ncbi:MAG TPA: AsmA-like C-terminal region-containing protein [Pseudomonadales bacterium]